MVPFDAIRVRVGGKSALNHSVEESDMVFEPQSISARTRANISGQCKHMKVLLLSSRGVCIILYACNTTSTNKPLVRRPSATGATATAVCSTSCMGQTALGWCPHGSFEAAAVPPRIQTWLLKYPTLLTCEPEGTLWRLLGQ